MLLADGWTMMVDYAGERSCDFQYACVYANLQSDFLTNETAVVGHHNVSHAILLYFQCRLNYGCQNIIEFLSFSCWKKYLLWDNVSLKIQFWPTKHLLWTILFNNFGTIVAKTITFKGQFCLKNTHFRDNFS